jgi:hypothetical protein
MTAPARCEIGIVGYFVEVAQFHRPTHAIEAWIKSVSRGAPNRRQIGLTATSPRRVRPIIENIQTRGGEARLGPLRNQRAFLFGEGGE